MFGEIDYDCIILDEIHERSINTDILIPYLKQKALRKKFKLILMSANLESKILRDYFENFKIIDIK